MGYTSHHAILVTAFGKEYAEDAYEKAAEIFAEIEDWSTPSLQPSPIMESPANSYYTFVIPPDGSKEGWPPSDKGNECRERFASWLDQQRYGDGSSPYAWAVVRYGDENGNNALEVHEATTYAG